MPDLEGIILGDYLLLECVSKGSIADVYRAQRNGEGSYEAAVKVFRPGYAQHESFRKYFMAEAEKIGHLVHPNILPFLAYGEREGVLYAVTPFVTNGTLENLLARAGGRFSAIQALPIVQQLCSAVQYAHEHDVIHGNIKPTNVFVTVDGRVLLADFGIVRGYGDSQQSLTRIGWDSAEYAAPEQSLGVLRRASDIYSLGALLFRVLTGSPPFTGQTPVEVLLKHVRQQPPSARTIVANISDAVDGVLRTALQKRSDDRFASAEELSNAFQAAVAIAPIASPFAKLMQVDISQLAHSPSAVTKNLQTQHPYSVIGDPQTPLPASLALFSPDAPASFSSPTSSAPSDLSLPAAQEQLAQPSLTNTEEPMGTAVREIRKKNFLQEKEEMGLRFWSVDPAEWSPIASSSGAGASNAIPLTAGEYLSGKHVASQKMPEPVILGSSSTLSRKADKKKQSKNITFSERLRKWLPFIIVALLLLGLLGALISTFLFMPD
ncbi:MAG: protein kinase [Chloroflexi bacterium]|nr:protein kinase [Chloroflexota bacterium]